MKIGQEEINKIHEITKKQFSDQSPVMYWDMHLELTQSEKLAVAWIESISAILDLDIEVDIKKPLGLSDI